MLPFLKNKRITSVIIAQRKPDGTLKNMDGDAAPVSDLSVAAEDLIKAVHAKNVEGVSNALQAAFDIMDSKEESNEGEGFGEASV